MDDFPKRLELIFKHYELTAGTFADLIGVQRSSISHLVSGRNKPSLDFIVKLLEKFPEVNFQWLVKGKGEMIISEESVPEIKKSNTPTLFDQVFDNSPVQPKKEEIVKQEIKLENSEVDASIKKIKPIDKVLVLYKDGSFDSYVN